MHLTLIRLSFIYLLAGMALGIVMAAAGDATLRPVHAHANLLGWLTLVASGVLVRLYPELARSRLTRAYFWLFNIALPVNLMGLAALLTGNGSPVAESLAKTSAALCIVAVSLLCTAVWRLRAS